MNNFINEIVGMKSTQETTASKTSLNSVNATLSKVRFGKLTFNRGPSQDEAEEKITILADASKPHNSRNMQSVITIIDIKFWFSTKNKSQAKINNFWNFIDWRIFFLNQIKLMNKILWKYFSKIFRY